jgi:hypothetical protein
MDKLKDILWPIILIGGLGAFIDFLIGRTGQERAKDFLLKWWVRFDDVGWKNFGREEGLFAGQLIERWFGRRIWSSRRILVAVLLFILFLLGGYITRQPPKGLPDIWCLACKGEARLLILEVILAYMAYSLSMSFTKFITFRLAYLSGDGTFRNLSVFIVVLIINYLVILLWHPIMDNIKGDLFFLSFGYKAPPRSLSRRSQSGSHRTPRWRKTDSNSQSHVDTRNSARLVEFDGAGSPIGRSPFRPILVERRRRQFHARPSNYIARPTGKKTPRPAPRPRGSRWRAHATRDSRSRMTHQCMDQS